MVAKLVKGIVALEDTLVWRTDVRMSILQFSLPYDPLSPKPLLGISPLDPSEWLMVDEAYAGQVAEKQRVLAAHRSDVLMQEPVADEAADELLSEVTGHLLRDHKGFELDGQMMTCPDGRQVDCSGSPLEVLGGLVQEDLCILQKPEGQDEHIFTAGLLAFPASWRLKDKFMQPLTLIHVPVGEYDDVMAKRVQRLFDGIQVGRPLWRFNALWYQAPDLHQPRAMDERRPHVGPNGPYMRSERQTLLRLPLTGAVVFGIHTFVVRRSSLGLAEQ